MTKLLLAALFSLTALSPAARADEYDDRAKLAGQRANQEYQTRYWNGVYAGNVKDLRALNGFISRGGGLSEDGACQMMTASCQTLSYSGQTFCSGGAYVSVPFSAIDPAAAYYFISCRFNLRNGLACSVWENLLGSGYKASCYDASGNQKELSFGAGAAAPAKRKRKK